MLKRIGLFTAALFATLALMQLPTASAQNRDGNGGYGYNTHQTNSYDHSHGQRHGNSYASQNGSGDNRQPSGYGSNNRQQNVYNNDGRSNVYASNNRQLNMRQSQFDSHSKFDSRSNKAPRMTGNSLRRLAVVPAFRR
jgi:hypothetical protein